MMKIWKLMAFVAMLIVVQEKVIVVNAQYVFLDSGDGTSSCNPDYTSMNSACDSQDPFSINPNPCRY